MSMSKVIFVNYDDRTSWLHESPKHSVQEYDDGDVFVDEDVDYGEGDGDGDGYYLQAWTRLGSRGRQRDSTAQPTPPQCCSLESNWGWPKIISIWSGHKVMIMVMMTTWGNKWHTGTYFVLAWCCPIRLCFNKKDEIIYLVLVIQSAKGVQLCTAYCYR